MCRELREHNQPTFSLSFDRISPVLLLVITILAAILFISGLLHLLVRYLKKSPSFSPVFNSNRFPENSGSRSLRRQLQQLFRQHDSGLDQASVDALPVFYYTDIIGLKEPFDCAVCLCEFSERDKLRLLPVCGHAFHLDCIDAWLLSNSTCPLCRRSLLSSTAHHPIENSRCFRPEWFVNQSMTEAVSCQQTVTEEIDSSSDGKTPVLTEEEFGEKRLFSVRLGKFRIVNEGQDSSREGQQGETSRWINMDARRCYSMGTVQYVVSDSNLSVALPDDSTVIIERMISQSLTEKNGEGANIEDKKIKGRSRGDSFSVSKIWLWSKKIRIPSSGTSLDMNGSSILDACEIERYV